LLNKILIGNTKKHSWNPQRQSRRKKPTILFFPNVLNHKNRRSYQDLCRKTRKNAGLAGRKSDYWALNASVSMCFVKSIEFQRSTLVPLISENNRGKS